MRIAHVLTLAAACSTTLLTGCATHHHTPGTNAHTDQYTTQNPLGFLAGHWRHDDGETVMEEIWFPPHPPNGASAGVLRWTAPDGSVRMYELLSLTPNEAGGLDFALRHFSGAMQPWASEAEGPFRGVVDHPEPNRLVIRGTERHGDVETITYERTRNDLVSTLRFREGSGRDPIVIGFKLVE